MPGRLEKCTSFQIYTGSNVARNVIDLTERRLRRIASKAKDPQQKALLLALIDEYRRGLVAVAWRRGAPIPLRLTQET